MTRRRVSSNSPLEPVIGFSRAVRIGDFVCVSGTAPIGDDGQSLFLGDMAGQTRACFGIAKQSLAQLGASLHNVIRTRIMLTDASRWKEAAEVHGEFFSDIMPACTFVEVKGFINKEWLVEVEVDAVVPSDR